MKDGDKVRLKYIPDDLRYDVSLNDVGVIEAVNDNLYTYKDETTPRKHKYNIAVKWFKNKPAMTHQPDELEIVP